MSVHTGRITAAGKHADSFHKKVVYWNNRRIPATKTLSKYTKFANSMYRCGSLPDGESRCRPSFGIPFHLILCCLATIACIGLGAAHVYAQAPKVQYQYEVYEKDGLLTQRFAERRSRIMEAMPD